MSWILNFNYLPLLLSFSYFLSVSITVYFETNVNDDLKTQ